jgi:hypothetical protein
MYVGRLKSIAHMLVEREQKQIARSGKKYMKVQFLSLKSIYLFFNIVTVKANTYIIILY